MPFASRSPVPPLAPSHTVFALPQNLTLERCDPAVWTIYPKVDRGGLDA